MTPPELRHEEVFRALRQVRDPELEMDIVHLGLVYDVEIHSTEVAVTMTLTTPGCPLAGPMTEGARKVVLDLPWVTSAEVRLVWDPPWTPDRIGR